MQQPPRSERLWRGRWDEGTNEVIEDPLGVNTGGFT